jgi:hypothetical protein
MSRLIRKTARNTTQTSLDAAFMRTIQQIYGFPDVTAFANRGIYFTLSRGNGNIAPPILASVLEG